MGTPAQNISLSKAAVTFRGGGYFGGGGGIGGKDGIGEDGLGGGVGRGTSGGGSSGDGEGVAESMGAVAVMRSSCARNRNADKNADTEVTQQTLAVAMRLLRLPRKFAEFDVFECMHSC